MKKRLRLALNENVIMIPDAVIYLFSEILFNNCFSRLCNFKILYLSLWFELMIFKLHTYI